MNVREDAKVHTYYCALAYQCKCKVQLKLKYGKTECAIFRHGKHEQDSHKENKSKYLNTAQKLFIEGATKCKPMELPCTIRRGTYNLPEEQRIGPEHQRGLGNLVRKVRKTVIDGVLQSDGETAGPKATLLKFARKNCMYKLLDKHRRSDADDHCLKLDEVFCIGHQLDDGVLYLGVSSFSLIMNNFRQINSGHDFVYMGDGTFNLCDHKLCALTANVNELRNKNYWIAVAFCREESSDYYAALYKDILRCTWALKKFPICKRDKCEVCMELAAIRAGLHYKEWLATLRPGQEMMLPVKYTMSDNTGKIFKFVKEVIRNALCNLCRGHLTGVARQKQQHIKYFRPFRRLSAADWYEKFYDVLLLAMNNPYLHFANHLQHMILNWLTLHGQAVAVSWFHAHWMGKVMDGDGVGGRWMICHFGYCGPFNNNGTEGNNGGYKSAAQGVVGAKCALTVRELLANTCSYIARKGEEQRHALREEFGTSASFRTMPGVQAKDVAKLKKMHPFAMVLATPIGYEDSWHSAMDVFLKIGETALPAYDRLSRYQREIDTIGRLDLEDLWEALDREDEPCVDIYFPSDKFLIQIDKSRDKSLETLRTIVEGQLDHHRLLA